MTPVHWRPGSTSVTRKTCRRWPTSTWSAPATRCRGEGDRGCRSSRRSTARPRSGTPRATPGPGRVDVDGPGHPQHRAADQLLRAVVGRVAAGQLGRGATPGEREEAGHGCALLSRPRRARGTGRARPPIAARNAARTLGPELAQGGRRGAGGRRRLLAQDHRVGAGLAQHLGGADDGLGAPARSRWRAAGRGGRRPRIIDSDHVEDVGRTRAGDRGDRIPLALGDAAPGRPTP